MMTWGDEHAQCLKEIKLALSNLARELNPSSEIVRESLCLGFAYSRGEDGITIEEAEQWLVHMHKLCISCQTAVMCMNGNLVVSEFRDGDPAYKTGRIPLK
jgi:hypothetical protein